MLPTCSAALLLLIDEFCCYTDISEFSGTKRVESSDNLVSSLLLDNEFKSCHKTINNVEPKPEPCTKPRLNDSNLETILLKRQCISCAVEKDLCDYGSFSTIVGIHGKIKI